MSRRLQMQFIRFRQRDPDYDGLRAEVAVALSQIVKIEPRYFQLNAQGERFLAQATQYGEEEALKGLDRIYIVWDSLGKPHSSDSASEAGKKLIEQLWTYTV